MEMKPHGLYLVVSPILPTEQLISATEKALKGGVDLLQYSAGKNPADLPLVKALADLARAHSVSFLVNNDLELAKAVCANGVHFDGFEVAAADARKVLGGDAIVGYTVNANLSRLEWAERTGADYVSFCSVFSVCEGSSCPIVPLETVKSARSITRLPIFAAGGVKLENVHFLLEAAVDGLVVTSAILNAKDPQQAATALKKEMTKNRKRSG
jgi:thiamine-phosphate pyrophosphorylase